MYSYIFGGPATRTVKSLIIINIAVYLLQVVFDAIFGVDVVAHYFGLIPAYVTQDYTLWQFVTYMFLHGGPFHILFNMLTLFMFGNELQRYWGSRRFLIYYFVTGIGAGLCSWLVAMDSTAIVIGASGAIYGLLLAYGMTYPNRVVYLNFLLPIKVKWLVVIMGAIAFISSGAMALLSSISDKESGVAHIAHLGGMVVGYLYLKGQEWGDKYRSFNDMKRREKLKRQFELYYGDVRRNIEHNHKKGPTIH